MGTGKSEIFFSIEDFSSIEDITITTTGKHKEKLKILKIIQLELEERPAWIKLDIRGVRR